MVTTKLSQEFASVSLSFNPSAPAVTVKVWPSRIVYSSRTPTGALFIMVIVAVTGSAVETSPSLTK